MNVNVLLAELDFSFVGSPSPPPPNTVLSQTVGFASTRVLWSQLQIALTAAPPAFAQPFLWPGILSLSCASAHALGLAAAELTCPAAVPFHLRALKTGVVMFSVSAWPPAQQLVGK